MSSHPQPRRHSPSPRRLPRLAPGLGLLLLLSALGTGCALLPPPSPPPPAAAPPAAAPPAAAGGPAAGSFTLLAINDISRIQGPGTIVDGTGERGGLARLRTLRRELEASRGPVLLLHAGDFLAPSMLSRRHGGRQMIDVLNRLDGDPQAFDPAMFVTFGDHEFDASGIAAATELDARIETSQFHWLGSNLWFDTGPDGEPLVAASNLSGTALVTVGGVRVGLFSLTTEIQRPDYLVGFYDRDDTAYDATAELRAAGADVVVALTHLALAEDMTLLERLGDRGPDLVIGGHEHQAIARQVDGRWILKADADAVTARVIEVTPRPEGPPAVDHRLVELGPDSPAPDPQVAAAVAGWLDRFDREHCGEAGLGPGCLDRPVGRTTVELVGEESEIRRFETGLGDWVADRLRRHWAEAVAASDPGAPLVAVVTSGALRLDRDIAPGWITRREIDELFAYPAPTVLLRVDGRTVKRMLARSVEGWHGAGHWLQVSGLAFAHDPEREAAERITLLTPDGPRPLGDTDRVYVATLDSLVDPKIGDRDGYAMIGPGDVVSRSQTDLRDLVLEELHRTWDTGIAPRREGRICNPRRPGPCLAVSAAAAGS